MKQVKIWLILVCFGLCGCSLKVSQDSDYNFGKYFKTIDKDLGVVCYSLKYNNDMSCVKINKGDIK